MSKLSLQEQLLKSGLVSKGQVNTAKSEKHKQIKQQQHNKVAVANDLKIQAEQKRLEQIERDRELNLKRQQQEERKQIAAQIKQLVEQSRLPKENPLAGVSEESLAYNFVHKNKVKTIYVPKPVRDQLVEGKLAVVRYGQDYEIVPAETAEKIKIRDESRVIGPLTQSSSTAEHKEDPYAGYEVPDDLMW